MSYYRNSVVISVDRLLLVIYHIVGQSQRIAFSKCIYFIRKWTKTWISDLIIAQADNQLIPDLKTLRNSKNKIN